MIDIVGKSKVINNYLVETNTKGQIKKEITIKPKLMDSLINKYNLRDSRIIPYKNNTYITMGVKDIFFMKPGMPACDLDEIPDSYSIYILDPGKKKIERYKNLTKVIEDNIKKLSSLGFLLRSDVHIYDSYYYETDDALYFTLTKFKGNSCSKEFENYLAAYSFKSDRIKILRLEADFDYSTFLGLKNNIFYFWKFKEYSLVGITPRDFF